MNPQCQPQEHAHLPTSTLASHLTTLGNREGHPFIPVFFYPRRTVSCDAVCLSRSPSPNLFLARVRFHQTKKVSETAYPTDLPQCPGLLTCLHSDRRKVQPRPPRMFADHAGDTTSDTCVVDRTVFPYIPLTNLENIVENQDRMIPACAWQLRHERGTQTVAFSSAAIRHILCPIVDTLVCLHHAGFAHNNVRAENVLITADLAVYLHGIDSLPSTLCEHVRWRSPELTKLNTQPTLDNQMSGDVWALGCLLFYLATLIKPFHDEEDSLTILADLQLTSPAANSFSRPSPCLADRIGNVVSGVKDADLKTLITQCLTIDASKRPNIDLVRASPFFCSTANLYAPTTYGALVHSLQTSISESISGAEDDDTKAVADLFTEETLDLPCVAIMVKNAILLSILGPILESDSNVTSSAGVTATSNEDDIFTVFDHLPRLGRNEPFVSLPLLELIREFPTSCALNFSADAFDSPCDAVFYEQCVAHAELMLQGVSQSTHLSSVEDGKDCGQPFVGGSSFSFSNGAIPGNDVVFASDYGAATNTCRTADDDEEQESNVIDTGVLALHDGNEVDQAALHMCEKHDLDFMSREVEAVHAHNQRRGCMSLKRVVIVVSVTMLAVVIVVCIIIAVVYSHH